MANKTLKSKYKSLKSINMQLEFRINELEAQNSKLQLQLRRDHIVTECDDCYYGVLDSIYIKRIATVL